MTEKQMIKIKCNRNSCGAGGGTSRFSAAPQDSHKFPIHLQFHPEILAEEEIFYFLRKQANSSFFLFHPEIKECLNSLSNVLAPVAFVV